MTTNGDDAFNTSAPRGSSLAVPRKPTHRPTLTTLINSTDLSAATHSASPLGSLGELGEGEDGLVELPDAPELNHALFEGDDFDPSEFLLARRHTSLEDLRSELRAYLATLRTSLVGVINQEYEAFIGLSLGLKHAHVAQSLATIRRPVQSIRADVTTVERELQEMRREMADALSERKRCRDLKVVMRRLLATEAAVEKVETMLQIANTNDGGDGDAQTRQTRPRPVDAETLDSPANRLDRIASEYNHMLYLVSRAGDLPFVKTLDERIDRITSSLKLDLSRLLVSILSSRPPSSSPSSRKSWRDELTSAFESFASLGLMHEAEEIVRKTVVKPFLFETITRDALGSSSNHIVGGVAAADDDDETTVPRAYRLDPVERPVSFKESDSGPLLRLYNRLLKFIAHDCGDILSIAERSLASPSIPGPAPASSSPSSRANTATTSLQRSVLEENRRRTSLSRENEERDDDEDDDDNEREVRERDGGRERRVEGFEILTNVIVDEIATRLVSEVGTVVFAAGRPSVFHQNYLLTTEFLSRIESLCPTLGRLERLRAHPPYQALLRRFQLPVYFQLRFKESVAAVERAFELGQASGGATASSGFVMSESESVWNAVERVWADEVWLEELAGKFWRLTLQIMSRYRTWVNDKVPRYVLPASSSSANLAALSTANTSRSSFEGGDRGGRLTPNAANRPGTPVLTAATDEASEETILRQLTVLIADARLMEKKVTALFEQRIEARLPGDEPAQPGSAKAIMRDSLASLTSIVPSLSSQIVTILVKRCSEPLKLVRSVASQVRASSQHRTKAGGGPAAEPSYFVHNILKELRQYLVAGAARTGVIDDDLRREWATTVVDDVATRYCQILSTQKKTEDSLRWLKKGRQGLSFFGRAAAASGSTTGGGGGEDADEDRVRMQMRLDVETLGEDARALGVDVDHSEAFAALRRASVGNEDGNK